MLIIIGTGAVASELTLFADQEIKGYLEYSENITRYYDKYRFTKPVLGNVDNYQICSDDYFAVGIADIQFRLKMINIIKSRGGRLVNIISSKAIVDKKNKLGEGNIISPLCIVESNVIMGNYNLLTATAIISHDSVIGSNNVFSASLLCGHVHAGDNNRFCIRATVIPEMTIGNNNTIGPGMIVEKNIKNNTTVFHNFKEKIYFVKP